MPAYRYYEDERIRWAVLGDRKRIDYDEARLGICRLAAHFGLSLRRVSIEFTSGRRWSLGGHYLIRINMDMVSWLLIAHEVAHCWISRKHARRSPRCHNKAHRRVTDRFCRWIQEQGWREGSLAHEVALEGIQRETESRQERRAAAEPPPIEHRIAQREAQVKRLQTHIKALTTRLRRAQRSLSALERVRSRPPRERKPPAERKPRAPRPRGMSIRQQVLALAATMDVAVDRDRDEIEMDAPPGKVWSGGQCGLYAFNWAEALKVLQQEHLSPNEERE